MIYNTEIKDKYTIRTQEAFKVLFGLETVAKTDIENILKKYLIRLVRQHELTQSKETAKQNYKDIA